MQSPQSVISLAADRNKDRWLVQATHLSGKPSWIANLPPGVYTGLGSAGETTLVHALRAELKDGIHTNCVIALRGPKDTVKLVETEGDASPAHRLSHAGDSCFLKVLEDRVEVWQFDRSLRRLASLAVPGVSHMALVESMGTGKFAVVQRDASAWWAIDLASGSVARKQFAHEIIAGMKLMIQPVIEHYRSHGVVDGQFGVIAATGGDGEGRLDLIGGVIEGSKSSKALGVFPWLAISFDGRDGRERFVANLQTPRIGGKYLGLNRMINCGTQVGVLCGDSVVAWYEAGGVL